MSSATVSTLVKMLESLPDSTQKQVVEHLREYLLDLESENQWDEHFRRTQGQLGMKAEQMRKDITAGIAEPFDLGRL